MNRLRADDIILKVNGKSFYKTGDTQLTFKRGETSMTLVIFTPTGNERAAADDDYELQLMDAHSTRCNRNRDSASPLPFHLSGARRRSSARDRPARSGRTSYYQRLYPRW